MCSTKGAHFFSNTTTVLNTVCEKIVVDNLRKYFLSQDTALQIRNVLAGGTQTAYSILVLKYFNNLLFALLQGKANIPKIIFKNISDEEALKRIGYNIHGNVQMTLVDARYQQQISSLGLNHIKNQTIIRARLIHKEKFKFK